MHINKTLITCIDNQTDEYCPIIQKGNDNSDENIYQRQPGIFLNTKDNTLKIFISTIGQQQVYGEFITSNARLLQNKWHLISFIKQGEKVKLYVNGILDGIKFLDTQTLQNDGNLYVGNTPSSQQKQTCNLDMYIDDLKIYNKGLNNFEVQAEIGNQLGGIEPSALHFGCLNCELQKAIDSCIDGYHLCTTIELYSGIYQVARIMGWIEWNNKIWTYNSFIDKLNQNQQGLGLGICCKNI
ncbi:Concanavalin A-like lectin/glucanases superfamily [Pseudocohnilembus persalinus]|uniref:Concanavalin A-like lectin/glucanases superfamily n=1 Tax=Pseudocohnilembus persalinus TaxID=266149 RepID=A0A0V0QHX2_PSEPJ|nr:Concanavalin A-like lectin/glucanases superfamily [Pseudocohnilembus persalinus]|eukprot:KRX01889.1 Concanavalin A-like lectin/glucanases superfamily [Pseudocohnilembus persalinus]